MNDLEVRELRYFVAVAEELHFGRAAERLGMAQPPLSKAIRQLEQRLGVRLLERTTRRVALTPAGSELLAQARTALEAVAAAGRRAQRAGREEPRLAVVLKADGDAELLPAILDAYAREEAALPADVVVGGWGEAEAMLRDGRADVALLSTPLDDRGIDWEALVTEPRVAALPSGHRLAGRKRLRVADLAGEPIPRWAGADEAHADFWAGRDRASGRGPRAADEPPAETALPVDGPPVTDLTQVLRLVELGRAVAFLPSGIAERYPRRQIVYRPVVDLSPVTFVVAWPATSHSLAVAAFVRAATTLGAGRRRAPAAVR
jgi:DNA-binding transcriptional LysR family regulator